MEFTIRRSISQALNGQNNSLGLIRFVMAALVIVDHSYTLGGWGYTLFVDEFKNQTSLGGLAVFGFFAISGYLITKSGMSSDVMQFMWRRFLRIFPAFWGVLVVAAFVIGPIVWVATGHGLRDYFSFEPSGPFRYLWNNWTLTINQLGIYDIFADTPFGQLGAGSVLNGVLWTLTYEWACYLMVAVLVVAGVLKLARFVVPIVAVGLLILTVTEMAAPGSVGSIIPWFGDSTRLTFALVFFAGGCIAVYADRIPFDDRLGIVSGLAAAVTLFTGGFTTFGFLPFAYFLLYLAARLPAFAHVVGRKNDYSYGLYLFGWPVQQIFAFLGVFTWGFPAYAGLSILGAFVFAYLSWHGIEKWAMKLHGIGPGRGIAYWWAKFRHGRLRTAKSEARPDSAEQPVDESMIEPEAPATGPKVSTIS